MTTRNALWPYWVLSASAIIINKRTAFEPEPENINSNAISWEVFLIKVNEFLGNRVFNAALAIVFQKKRNLKTLMWQTWCVFQPIWTEWMHSTDDGSNRPKRLPSLSDSCPV